MAILKFRLIIVLLILLAGSVLVSADISSCDDAGKVFNVSEKGSILFDEGRVFDRCINGIYFEAYCFNSTTMAYDFAQCPGDYGCVDDYSCFDMELSFFQKLLNFFRRFNLNIFPKRVLTEQIRSWVVS